MVSIRIVLVAPDVHEVPPVMTILSPGCKESSRMAIYYIIPASFINADLQDVIDDAQAQLDAYLAKFFASFLIYKQLTCFNFNFMVR